MPLFFHILSTKLSLVGPHGTTRPSLPLFYGCTHATQAGRGGAEHASYFTKTGDDGIVEVLRH